MVVAAIVFPMATPSFPSRMCGGGGGGAGGGLGGPFPFAQAVSTTTRATVPVMEL